MNHIYLDGRQLLDAESMRHYFSKLFDVEEDVVSDLEKTEAFLSETLDAYHFILRSDCIRTLCASSYGYGVLLMIGRAADRNPFIQVNFDDSHK